MESLPPGVERHRTKYRARKRINGVRVRQSFSTLEEAIAFLQALDADSAAVREAELRRIAKSLTVRDIVDDWWLGPLIDGERTGGHRRRIAALTARDYQLYIDRYISQVADRPAREYDQNPALLKFFYDSLPNRMAWHVHSVLRMALAEAVARRHLERNPCEFQRPARRKRTQRITPSRDEVDMILAAAEAEDPLWGLFNFLTATLGPRAGETCALMAEDFDRPGEVVHILRAVSKTAGRPILKEPRNGQPRHLWMDDTDFWDYVEPFLRKPGFLFRGFYRDEQHKGPDARVKPWHPDHAQARFRKMIRRLGLPPYTLHSVRHFAATQLLIEGQPINQVAEFLGHTPQMTLMLYGRHADLDALRRVGRAAARITKRARPDPATAQDRPDPKSAAAPGWRWALDLICEMAGSAPVTNGAVQMKTGLSRRQASKALDLLVREGRLVRTGEGRTTHYVLPQSLLAWTL